MPLILQILLTKATEQDPGACPKLPNIGRMKTGCGVGMLAFGSPIWDQAMTPPLMTISGFAPKRAGFQSTRSASLPGSTEPIKWLIPWAIAGLIVYLEM